MLTKKNPTGEQLLADVAFRRLEEMIVTRRLVPGTMVSEAQLATELNMGRTPIREALQRLRQIGFVEMQPRRGTFVSRVDVREQLELLEVRRPLEELLVRSAAIRASDDEREELERLAREILGAAEREDVPDYFRINREIHEVEARATHNAMLIATLQAIHAQSRRFWYLNVMQGQAFVEGAERHAAVASAIAAGDAPRAIEEARELMQFLERLTRSTLDAFSV